MGPQSAYLWWPAVAKLQAYILGSCTMWQTDRRANCTISKCPRRAGVIIIGWWESSAEEVCQWLVLVDRCASWVHTWPSRRRCWIDWTQWRAASTRTRLSASRLVLVVIIVTSPVIGLQSSAMSVSVIWMSLSMSVCISVCICQKPHV